MPQSVTYFPDHKLVYLHVWGTVSITSLAARMAEWMYEFSVPTGYNCLTDTRGIEAVDRAADGVKELVNMQARVYQDTPSPQHSAIFANSPVGFVLGRLFEQNAEGVLREKIQVFRSERDALGFIGVKADSVDAYLASLPAGRTAT
ncbi:hypothetical protein [Aliiroseovarius lamellibrachiae]|uniref:hypothetical protein n=1 Tax=Aliiroseovarius lamellibrachiae TaxID=1924933 RepID=UPI001BDF8036|nr:hypothetical protein [Aliiroseovarius lamellibrachiae]MBT2130752.1 hypothetical protein [Aliiroseovarius lamellibrachiae]